MKQRWFDAGQAAVLRAWFAAHPNTRLRLIPVGNGFFVTWGER